MRGCVFGREVSKLVFYAQPTSVVISGRFGREGIGYKIVIIMFVRINVLYDIYKREREGGGERER